MTSSVSEPATGTGSDIPAQKSVTIQRTIPVRHDVDVLVAGGGPAGVAAAVAAARQGCSVFLAERHTVNHMRNKALWMSRLPTSVTESSDIETSGLLARAQARVKTILQTHEVPPLSDDAGRQLDEIMERARRDLGRP